VGLTKLINGAMAQAMEAKACGASMYHPNLHRPVSRTQQCHNAEPTMPTPSTTMVNEDTMQAMQTSLEQAQPGDNIAATLLAILGF
jgi:hypothetical protein